MCVREQINRRPVPFVVLTVKCRVGPEPFKPPTAFRSVRRSPFGYLKDGTGGVLTNIRLGIRIANETRSDSTRGVCGILDLGGVGVLTRRRTVSA